MIHTHYKIMVKIMTMRIRLSATHDSAILRAEPWASYVSSLDFILIIFEKKKRRGVGNSGRSKVAEFSQLLL